MIGGEVVSKLKFATTTLTGTLLWMYKVKREVGGGGGVRCGCSSSFSIGRRFDPTFLKLSHLYLCVELGGKLLLLVLPSNVLKG